VKKLLVILAFVPAISRADVVSCNSEIWSPSACAPFIESFKQDPYPYLSYITKTLAAAKVAIVSGANRGLVPSWNEKLWDVIGRSNELSGFLQAQNEDPRRVMVKDPNSEQVLEVSVFAGCYYSRDEVIAKDISTCDEFLAPASRMFYLGMRAYAAICDSSEEAQNCKALADFYRN
jgi:hypothetical protein